jgi:hypothetical protein
MATKNEITGDKIQSKPLSKSYLNNYDKIFQKKDSKGNGNEARVQDQDKSLQGGVYATD